VSLVERLLTSLNLPTQRKSTDSGPKKLKNALPRLTRVKQSLSRGRRLSLISVRSIGDEILLPPDAEGEFDRLWSITINPSQDLVLNLRKKSTPPLIVIIQYPDAWSSLSKNSTVL